MEAIQDQMALVFLKLKYDKNGRKFIEEFFSPTEKVMFAKRLAIVVMRVRGVSFYEISASLKVSTSTVSRIDEQIKRGELESVVRYVTTKKHKGYLEKWVLTLIFLSSPESMGKNRWKFLDVLGD